MFKGWDRLNDAYVDSTVADAYTITIHYGDKAVTASDIAPTLPQQFRKIFTEIEAIAAQAGSSTPPPTAPPPPPPPEP
jgi:hypothetical protein